MESRIGSTCAYTVRRCHLSREFHRSFFSWHLPFSFLIIGGLSATLLAQKKPKPALKDGDARTAIVATAGAGLKKSSVKVKGVSAAGTTPVTVVADITIAFRFQQVEDEPSNIPSILKKKRWSAIEFRTGDRTWERLEFLQIPLGMERWNYAMAELDALTNQYAARLREKKDLEPLSRGPLTIKQFSTLASSAVVEVVLSSEFRLAKNERGKWTVLGLSIGEGSADVATILQSINRQKEARSRADMETIRIALEAFRRERGFYVVSDSETVLMDSLSPRFIKSIIRIDPWGRPYRYEGTANRFVLRSDGVDGQQNTPDDLALVSG